MTDQKQPALIDLDDTDLTVANPAEDVRGEKVRDREGEEIGKVDGLLIDEQEQRVRFLRIGSGGFLGIGEKHRLIPVDAVTAVNDDVHIDASRQHVADSPSYDPTLVDELEYGSYYDYYGYAPFWGPGYTYPGYPYR